MATKVQIRIVTGKGFVHDEDYKAYEGLSDDEIQELAAAYEVAHLGTMLDFTDPVEWEKLAQKGDVTEAELEKFQTCWQGKPLADGTVYALIVGNETEMAMTLAAGKLKERISSDRVVKAEGDKRFKSSSADARRNVAQMRTEGGVWGSTPRQGPPRF